MAAFVPPMLAKEYTPGGGAGTWPVLLQPKLDGVRMLAVFARGRGGGGGGGEVRLFSRAGNSFDRLLPHVFPPGVAAAVAAAVPDGTALDGELYAHRAGFQAVVSAVKNGDLSKARALKLRYHVYDAVLPGDRRGAAPYAERAAVVAAAVRAAARAAAAQTLSAVPTVEASGREQVEAWMDRWIAEGYEGAMVRLPSAPYEPGKRSSSLLKYKRFLDAEFEIVGFEEASGKDKGTVVFVCRAAGAAKPFRARPEGTRAERAELLRAAPGLVGKLLTVRFMGLTDAGLPRFPVGVAVRDYEA